jgi:dTDP-4-dehydrorhamnose 3,5-epimerase-like enzyme
MEWNAPFHVLDLVSHTDPRGFLVELLRFKDWGIPGEGQMYVFSVEPKKRRGDHYHSRKQEWFTCVSGEVTVLLSSQDGQNDAVCLSPEEPKIIYVAPGTSHALLNRAGQVAVVVSYGSEQHDPKDGDTYHLVAFPDYDS